MYWSSSFGVRTRLGYPLASGLRFRNVLMYWAKILPTPVSWLYSVIWYSYTSWISSILYRFSTANLISSVTHVPLMALSASEICRQSPRMFCSLTHVLHRQIKRFLLHLNGNTGWYKFFGGTIVHFIRPLIWRQACTSFTCHPREWMDVQSETCNTCRCMATDSRHRNTESFLSLLSNDGDAWTRFDPHAVHLEF